MKCPQVGLRCDSEVVSCDCHNHFVWSDGLLRTEQVSRSAPTTSDPVGPQNATESTSTTMSPVSEIVRLHSRKKKKPSVWRNTTKFIQSLQQTILIVTYQEFTNERARHGYFVLEHGVPIWPDIISCTVTTKSPTTKSEATTTSYQKSYTTTTVKK